MNVGVHELEDRPEFLDELVRQHGRQWTNYYADWGEKRARVELEECLNGVSLPKTFMAEVDGKLAGSVSLIFDDLPGREDLNPWLGSFLVLPEWRGCGVGRLLHDRAVAYAREAGVGWLYLFTREAEGYFARLGWEGMCEENCYGGPVVVMRLLAGKVS